MDISKTKKGKSLQSYFWFIPGSDPWITVGIFGLLIFGTIMLISTNQGLAAVSADSSGLLSDTYKQLLFFGLACFLMIWFDHIFSYNLYAGLEKFLVTAYLGAMIWTALFGVEVMGSRAWISLGFMTLQPSEFGKALAILTQACALYKARRERWRQKSFWRLFTMPLILLVFNCLILVLQKDFGSMIIFLGINLICMLIPGYPQIHKAQNGIKILLLLSLVGAGAIMSSDKAMETMARLPVVSHITIRIANAQDPYQDIYGQGYQPANSLYGIADAGLFGKGIGNSARKYGYLTQAESDYIFAIIVEETGILGIGWIVFCYTLILMRLLYYAFKTLRMDDKVLLSGTAAYLLLHFIINIGGVGALIPMTGVPLLFISSGGSALMAVSIMMGVCQNRIAHIRHNELAFKEHRVS